MEQHKIDRINELAKKKKESGLTDSELTEQKALREEYLLEIRANITGALDSTYIQYPDGRKVKVSKKHNKE